MRILPIGLAAIARRHARDVSERSGERKDIPTSRDSELAYTEMTYASTPVAHYRSCSCAFLRYLRVLAVLLLSCLAPPLRGEPIAPLIAGASSVEVPKEIVPWVPWVTDSPTEGLCPKLGDQQMCAWPSILAIDVGAAGAHFTFDVFVEVDGWAPLPGSGVNWPESIEVDGKTAVVLERQGAPSTRLKKGSHRITGDFYWAKAPETLMLPSNLGLVRLQVKGRTVEFPRREDNGAIWLQASASEGDESGERSEIEVFRRFEDAVPFEVTTLIVLNIAGKTRELRLMGATLRGSRELSIESPIPARLEQNGELVLQVHAGEHRVTLKSLFATPPTELSYAEHRPPWPAHEIWAYVPNNTLRQVVLSGVPGIDSAQTNLPEDWKKQQAYLVQASQALRFETKRRGEQSPPPNRLALERQWWLAFDGSGYTVQDHFTGTINRDFRLDLLSAPLGHAFLNGKDMLVTRGASGSDGIELRQPTLDLTAEWRFNKSRTNLPAIAWKSDVTSLSSTLNLPPGWDILHVSGADSASETWWSKWTLWSFFYVLLVAIAITRLFGGVSGLLALGTLIVTHGRDDSPMAFWAVLLGLLALLRLVPAGGFRQILRLSWLLVATGFAVVTVNFCIGEVRGAFFPITHPPAEATLPNATPPDSPALIAQEVNAGSVAAKSESVERNNEEVAAVEQELKAPAKANVSAPKAYGSRSMALSKSSDFFSEPIQQLDPEAVVQTGPGLPSWKWKAVKLGWSGPVQRDQQIKLYLLPPFFTTLLGCLRAIAVVLLGYLLVRNTSSGAAPPPRKRVTRVAEYAASVAVALGVLAIPLSVHAEPSSGVLEELKARLTRAPDCESCIQVERLELSVASRILETRAIVHAGAVTSYVLTGPVRSWVPKSVMVDGKPAKAMVLHSDGFLHVRLEPGTHRVTASGPIAGRELVVSPGSVAHRVTVSSVGYSVDGLRDGRVEGSLHFIADEKPNPTAVPEADTAFGSVRHLPPWLEISRTVELGVTWKVTTEVTRKSPIGEPLSLRYALLSGEEVTSPGAIVEGGQLVMALGRDDTKVTYQSVLKESALLELVAASDRPWSEHWLIRCSALFHCSFDGVAPYQQTDHDAYAPKFRPWPGEKLAIAIAKPLPAPGASRTIEQVHASYTPGQRLLSGALDLVAKVSKGSTLSIRLAKGSTVQQLAINGKEEPIRVNGSVLELSLQPGRQVLHLTWHEPRPQAVWFQAPKIELGGEAVNATVNVRLPSNRWLLFAWGPSMGPKVLLWSYLVMLVSAAWVLVRLPKNPLKLWQWALLCVGLSQVPVVLTVAILAWFFLMAIRGEIELKSRRLKNLAQVGLAAYTLFFLGCLCGAVYDGLVSNPDMLVAGASAYGDLDLTWYVDRIGGALPTPIVISLPVVVFRLLNLLWALWLASSLLSWLKWGWQKYSAGGLWVVPSPESPVGVSGTVTEGSPEPESPANADAGTLDVGAAATNALADEKTEAQALSDEDKVNKD